MLETLFAHLWVVIGFLVLGMVCLVKGADWMIDGASAMAKRFGISDLVIGLTVLAFGTSAPEFVVNMVSVADGATELAITNALGSNIINVYVVLGITALCYPVISKKRLRDFDIPMSLIAGVVLLLAMHIPSFLKDDPDGGIGRLGGILLMCMFCYYIFNTARNAKDHEAEETEQVEIHTMSLGKAIFLLIFGMAVLVVGAEMTVKSAVNLATRMGISEGVIGLTVIALGTSLPELATSVIAALKHNSDIALGNVFGSNIFNIVIVLGTSAVIRPLPPYSGLMLDVWMVIAGSALVWLILKTNRERKVPRWGGALLLVVYAAYLTYRLMAL